MIDFCQNNIMRNKIVIDYITHYIEVQLLIKIVKTTRPGFVFGILNNYNIVIALELIVNRHTLHLLPRQDR